MPGYHRCCWCCLIRGFLLLIASQLSWYLATVYAEPERDTFKLTDLSAGLFVKKGGVTFKKKETGLNLTSAISTRHPRRHVSYVGLSLMYDDKRE